jgi:hypothetical protein
VWLIPSRCPEWVGSLGDISTGSDFSRDLPAGVRCSFRLRDDLRSLAGKALRSAKNFPSLLADRLSTAHAVWRIEDQAFVLFLDTE